MDDDFRILFDYVEQMKRELQDEADLQTKSDEDEEKKCVHESIETEEAYVLGLKRIVHLSYRIVQAQTNEYSNTFEY